jgi:hypothetical protein
LHDKGAVSPFLCPVSSSCVGRESLVRVRILHCPARWGDCLEKTRPYPLGIHAGRTEPQRGQRRVECEKPKVPAGDKGFCAKAEKYAEWAKQVKTRAIPRRMRNQAEKVLAVRQVFRAGIEGTISGLGVASK